LHISHLYRSTWGCWHSMLADKSSSCWGVCILAVVVTEVLT
jgi:hypothetical protein